mgnify:CR=1 FL=1
MRFAFAVNFWLNHFSNTQHNIIYHPFIVIYFDTFMSQSAIDNNGGEHASRLLGRDKVALGCKINRGALTTSAVELRYNVARRTAQKYATVIKKGGCLYDKSGRPPAIDALGIQEVAEFIGRNPDTSKATIRTQLRNAHVNTLKRRRPATFDSPDEFESISRASVWRYERKAHDMALRTLCFDDISTTDESAGALSDDDTNVSVFDTVLNEGRDDNAGVSGDVFCDDNDGGDVHCDDNAGVSGEDVHCDDNNSGDVVHCDDNNGGDVHCDDNAGVSGDVHCDDNNDGDGVHCDDNNCGNVVHCGDNNDDGDFVHCNSGGDLHDDDYYDTVNHGAADDDADGAAEDDDHAEDDEDSEDKGADIGAARCVCQ